MTLAATELCLRAAAVTLLLVLAASMFADFRNVLAGRLVIAFALGAAAHAVTASIGAGEPISVWHAPLIALATGDMVVFWLFTRALFDDGFVLRWWHGLIWAAVVVFSFVNCMWIAPRGHAQAAITTVNLLGLVFIALAVAQTVGSWKLPPRHGHGSSRRDDRRHRAANSSSAHDQPEGRHPRSSGHSLTVGLVVSSCLSVTVHPAGQFPVTFSRSRV